MVIKVIDNDVDAALKECRRHFSEIKRKKVRGSYYLRPGLRIREKKKIAAIKRRFYQTSYNYGHSFGNVGSNSNVSTAGTTNPSLNQN